MRARLRQLLRSVGDSFWLVPALMVLGSVLAALALLQVDRAEKLPTWLDPDWIYNGGGTGARTLLGTVAASAIGVAGTVFSIMIAALSLAAGQMGPRLLRNFTSDRGVQFTLGAFLGTFSYALMVLRSVRTHDEGPFTPHLALTVGIALAFGCVATLVYFVAHMARRINVDTVVDLVSQDIHAALRDLVADDAQTPAPSPTFWACATPIVDTRRGYLQQVHVQSLVDWASRQGTSLRLLVRAGDYVFPGAPIALMTVPVPQAEAAIRNATAVGDASSGGSSADGAVRQLVEVAVRALSPGINDPNTAMRVLDRLGAALCNLAGQQLPTGVSARDGLVVVVPVLDYRALVNVMFHMIRQCASDNPAVLIHLLDVLTAVTLCEQDADRRAVLADHAALVAEDAHRDVRNDADRNDVQSRYQRFRRAAASGVVALVSALPAQAEG